MLLLLPGAFSRGGGLELYNRHIIKSFAQLAGPRQFTVDCVVLNDRAADIDSRYSSNDLNIVACNRSRIRFMLEAVRCAARRPDLVVIGHVNFAPLLFLINILSRRSVAWVLTYGIDFWHRLPVLRRRALQRARLVLAISDYTRRVGAQANGISPDQIALLPCAIDPFWYSQYRDSEHESLSQENVVLTVARLVKAEGYKGVDQVLHALAALRHRFTEVRYEVIGSGDDLRRLQTLAEELGVADRVTFRGRVSDLELANAYARCSFFIMPSEKEGFGIVYLEAALFRKPSIAGAHGGAPEVVKAGVTGELVHHGNVAETIDVMTRYLSNATVTRQHGAAARQHLEANFTYEEFVKRLEQHIGRYFCSGSSARGCL